MKRGSIFIDIGANMGYWSAFAASLVGPEGEVHAFEPVPAFHRSIERLRDANPGHHINPVRIALGGGSGRIDMTVVRPTAENYANFDTNIGSSSLLPGFLDHAAALTETISVSMSTFDGFARLAGLDLDRIGLIKIDVEGYEWACFDGMAALLDKPGCKVPILCEVLTDPARNERLDGAEVVRRLEGHGYVCLDATTLAPIDTSAMAFEENILCIDAREAPKA